MSDVVRSLTASPSTLVFFLLTIIRPVFDSVLKVIFVVVVIVWPAVGWSLIGTISQDWLGIWNCRENAKKQNVHKSLLFLGSDSVL